MIQLALAGLCIIVWIVNPQKDYLYYVLLIVTQIASALFFTYKAESPILRGDFVVKHRKVSISLWMLLLLASVFAANILISMPKQRHNDYIYLSIFILTGLFFRRLAEIRRNKLAMTTLAVDDGFLYSKSWSDQKREIGKLTKIDMSLLTSNIRLHFSSSPRLIVNRKTYFDDDIIALIRLIKERSVNNVEISESIQNYINSR